jgi:lipooligosaccharide transport system permease protein
MLASSVNRVVEVNARAYARTYRGTLISTFLSPVLFLSAMGMGLGTLVDSNASNGLGTFTYVDFLTPGLLAATAMQVAAGEATWPVMAGIKWVKTYHAALATPIGVPDLVAGNLIWIAVKLVLSSVVFVLIASLFGAETLGRGLLSVGPAVLTGVAFAAPIMAFTTYSENETRLSSLYRFGIIPLFLFSGTFFPVDRLPGWMHPIAYATPLFQGVELTRSVSLGTDTLWPPVLHLAYLGILLIVGWVVASRGLAKRMQP